ncbi:UbiA prenyltransferase family protein [Aequorivita viscosa]|uniref:Prenyltransferase n=1 Tax=Aequorivita viscosa TaxID=797419 RepID=A0A1M6DVK4_9FLAO|nr:hypothetical protein [Aequorivita viscosa]SDW48796.1 hypothetical protein SAMN05216556_10657 [Aequorivita viscosa]SHI77159.1 hypothetical protein SAMN04487908_105115 [Aequorivita viscosa]
MKISKWILAFYINSSIHVALAVVALTEITVLEYNLSVPKALWMFVFFGAVTGYNFVKYAKIAGLHHRHLTNSLKTIQIFSGLSFLALLYNIFYLPWDLMLIALAFGIPTFFYAVPLIRHKNLRSFTGIKIFIVAFVWAGITVIVPVKVAVGEVSVDVLLTFIQRILIVVVLMLPFEIRDVPYDSLNLKTLPQQIGVWGTKMLGEGILLICLVFEFFKLSTDGAYLISLLLFSVLLGAMLIISKPYQNRYFASFWIEGLPILWWGIYIFLAAL